jgi:exoribonuclease R
VAPVPTLRVVLPPERLPHGRLDLEALLDEVDAPVDFPPEAIAEAEQGARSPRMPALDRTDVPLVTLDPPGSTDLDQAFALERRGTGYRVHYAIADPAAFVSVGGALDAELARRGVTLYLPGLRVPLHPPVLGEDAASLLPGVDRPAVLWTLDLDADGAHVRTDVRRALVRSREQLDYPGVQAALASGSVPEQVLLMREVGLLRQEQARARGAVDLPTPAQEVELGNDGRPHLALRAPTPVEGWNAQLSLLTGMAAAALMLEGGVGLLRTLPPPAEQDVEALRRGARALGVVWPEGVGHGELVSGLDPSDPAAAAALVLATRLLRGAGYTAFDGSPPDQRLHAGVAAAYAHCTAPLRRLADRHVSEVCLALCAGDDVPEAVREALPGLPAVMSAATARSGSLERAVVDLAEAVVLQPCVGEEFDGVVVDAGPRSGTVQLASPAVRALVDGEQLPVGEAVRVRLSTVDVGRRTVRFSLA